MLIKATGANSALIYNFIEEFRHFNFMGQKGASGQKFEKLRPVVSSMLDTDVGNRTAGTLKKCNCVAIKFNPDDFKRFHMDSILVYYVFERENLISAIAFLKRKGSFKKFRTNLLNSTASLLLLCIENKTYREKTTAFASVVHFDGLTGLYNHRFFQESLSGELLRSQRFNYPVSLLMIDVDHFKQYNDKHSHPKGDIVLKEIAKILKKSTRAYDIPSRYGGEELAVILPYTAQQQALIVAERIRKNVYKYPFPGAGNNEHATITVSICISTFPLNAKTKSDVINRADQALYLAKSEGRNRVCLSLSTSKKLLTVGFCPPAFTSPYYYDILAGARDVKKEISNIDLLIRAPRHESDYNMLAKIIDEFVKKRVDAVALCTQSKTSAREIVKLNDAKIPVFMFNVPEKIEGIKIESYVGYDQKEAGKEVGRYLARILRGKGTVAVIEGLNEPTSVQRVSGFKEIIGNNPRMNIVAIENADWLREKAMRVTEKILMVHPEMDALFAVNDEMALGAVLEVESENRLGEIFVVGLDGTLDALKSIKEGKLTATLSTNPREMGKILIRTIVRERIREENIPQEIFSPINMVSLENVTQNL
jgi:diguanylate cyclase (GGDEF)-like protein